MFTVTSKSTFMHVVKVQVPVDGGHEEQSLKATFNVIPIDQMEAFDLSEPTDVTNFLRAAVNHLDDIVDDQGKPVPYNDALRDQMIDVPYLRQALASEYFASVSGAYAGN